MSGKKLSLSKRIHYRLVMGPVGYGLRQFKGTGELLHASYDVLQGSLYDCSLVSPLFSSRGIAMMDAHTKCSRLHRDISLGSIMLVAEPGRSVRTGYLVDWDASSLVDASGGSVRIGRAVRGLTM